MGHELSLKPIVMGALMGMMMLAMLHLMLTGNSTLGGMALVAFVGAHVAMLAAIVGLGVFAARLSPRTRDWMARRHRPSLSHVSIMLASAAIAAFSLHLLIHGGL